jgi:hypothetical protein
VSLLSKADVLENQHLNEVLNDTENIYDFSSFVSGGLNLVSSQGQADLQNFMITGHPQQSYILRFQNSDVLSFYKKLKNNLTKIEYDKFSSVYMRVDLRDCVPGEIYIKLENTKTCSRCRNTKYSLNINDTSCHNCPKGAKCLGGSEIYIEQGNNKNKERL